MKPDYKISIEQKASSMKARPVCSKTNFKESVICLRENNKKLKTTKNKSGNLNTTLQTSMNSIRLERSKTINQQFKD